MADTEEATETERPKLRGEYQQVWLDLFTDAGGFCSPSCVALCALSVCCF